MTPTPDTAPHDTAPHEGAGSEEGAGREFRLGAPQLRLLLGFVLTVLGLDFALARSDYAALGPTIHAENQLRLIAYATREDADDVLFVGSSRLRAGVDASAVSAYLANLTSPPAVAGRLPVQGVDAWMLERVVRDLVVPLPPRDLLVIAIEARLFYAPPFEADELLGLRLLGRAGDLLRLDPLELTPDQRVQWSRAPLRGVMAPWALPWLLAPDTRHKLEALRATRGQNSPDLFSDLTRREFGVAKAVRDRIEARQAEVGYEDIELRPFELAAFRRTLDLLGRLPCRTVFVRLPVEEGFDREQRRQLRAFEEFAVADAVARGFRYVDLNELPELRDPALFENPTHVTPEAARRVSAALARDVVVPALWSRVPEGLRPELRERLGPLAPAALRAGD